MSGYSLILSSKLFFEVLKNLQFGRPQILINLVIEVSIAAANFWVLCLCSSCLN